MPRSVRVAPEDLHMSAATVDAHANEVWLKHGAANGRIEAAQVGVPTGSAVALSAAVAKWQGDTTALFGRMVEYGGALRGGATRERMKRVPRVSKPQAIRPAHWTSGCNGPTL